MQQQFLIPHKVGSYSFINEVEDNKWTSIDQQSNKEVFIQLISKKECQTQDFQSKIMTYFNTLKKIHSTFFSRCLDFFEDKHNYYVVMEKPEGITLNEYVFRNKGKITEEYIKTFFTNLIEAYREMLNNNFQFSVTYNNIYVKDCNVFNLNEFKLTIIPYMMKSVISSSYMFEAPEVFLGKIKSSESNVWTCGVFLYYITTGTLPFSVTPFNPDEFQKIILNAEIQIPLYVPSNIKDIIARMIIKNPGSRIKFAQIFDHVWLKKESVKQTAKTYSHIDMDQFPTLWAQPNFIKEYPKDDNARSNKFHFQVVPKQKTSRFHIEKIQKQ